MKNVILCLIACVFVFGSCKKSKKCYNCTFTSYRDVDTTSAPNPSYQYREFCDWTKEEMQSFVKNSNHYTNGVTLVTVCEPK